MTISRKQKCLVEVKLLFSRKKRWEGKGLGKRRSTAGFEEGIFYWPSEGAEGAKVVDIRGGDGVGNISGVEGAVIRQV